MKENRNKPLLTIIYFENKDIVTNSDEDTGEWTDPKTRT